MEQRTRTDVLIDNLNKRFAIMVDEYHDYAWVDEYLKGSIEFFTYNDYSFIDPAVLHHVMTLTAPIADKLQYRDEFAKFVP